VLTSSCGRLFDAVASIMGLRHEETFEAQAAIELETVAQPGVKDLYPFSIADTAPAIVDLRPTITEIVAEVRRSQPAGLIASRFQNTVAAATVEMCRRIREWDGLTGVCLTGGTFQNIYLLARTVESLRACGFEVFLHAAVPPNDGGISLGQAVIASQLIRQGV
jgi:hydrogenase maturation protein HypF